MAIAQGLYCGASSPGLVHLHQSGIVTRAVEQYWVPACVWE